MPKLIFRGASIRYVDVRYDDKSKAVYTKIHLSAAFTDTIRQAMEWGEPPAGMQQAKLDGEVNATYFVLTPNGRELKQHELQIKSKRAGDFQVFRVKNEGGESTSNEIRFQVVTADPLAAAKLAEYLSVIGQGEAQLKINHEEQGELGRTGAAHQRGPGRRYSRASR